MRKPKKRRPRGRAAPRGTPRPCDRPRIDPRLKPVFQQIGVPHPKPFQPDPFQLEAVDRLRNHDVIVSAPTGAGKTWIATEAMRRLLAEDMHVWYASPLKALSNAIYQQFRQAFGTDRCGILTGDRKENPQAPIIVGTTEILRNQLYDAMHRGSSIGADLVILDEAHYLSDPERGVVWEEILIYLPDRVRLLLLSATIPNADELAAWLFENRGIPVDVVREERRPVPLEMLFLSPEGGVFPLGGRKGISGGVKKALESGRRGAPAYAEVIRCLRKLDLLPAIFFLKSRSDCDRAVLSCPGSGTPPRIRERAREVASDFLSRHPHLKGRRQWRPLVESLVGAHHAGQLPGWKLLIETMMEKGALEAIFSTSTVAAGVNFPARTVVLVQSDRFDGRAFRDLTARDLHQMIGRAGRRGKDRIGFALVLPGPYQDPGLVLALRDAPPEPLESRIHINFSMTLNLLLSHEPEEVRDLLGRSFAAFQRGRLDGRLGERWEGLIRALKRELSGGRCDTEDPFEVLEYIAGRRELERSLRRQQRERQKRAARRAYERHLEPGRLFLHKKGGVHLSFGCFEEDETIFCEALNVEKPLRTRKNRIRLRRVRLDRIELLFDRRLDLPEDPSPGAVSRMLEEVRPEDLDVLRIDASTGVEDAEASLKGRLDRLPCEDCPCFTDCHTPKNRRLEGLLQEIRSLSSRVEGMSEGLWLSFKRHLRFLRERGFVNEQDRLTPDGEWASELRLDHPLLIAESIRKGALAGTTPELLAGVLAPFVWDRDLDVAVHPPEGMDLDPLVGAWDRVVDAMDGIRAAKTVKGFHNPRIFFWPAAALYAWSGGAPWEDLLSMAPVDEGDMASLVMRTADHLRQVAGLRESHPEIASCADEAISAILREPVFLL